MQQQQERRRQQQERRQVQQERQLVQQQVQERLQQVQRREQERLLLFYRKRPKQQQRSRRPKRATCSFQFSLREVDRKNTEPFGQPEDPVRSIDARKNTYAKLLRPGL